MLLSLQHWTAPSHPAPLRLSTTSTRWSQSRREGAPADPPPREDPETHTPIAIAIGRAIPEMREAMPGSHLEMGLSIDLMTVLMTEAVPTSAKVLTKEGTRSIEVGHMIEHLHMTEQDPTIATTIGVGHTTA